MRLSVLDQSPVISGHTPAQAVHETIRLVKAAEQLGFHRYWLAEHHLITALADPCPEILLARVVAETSRIRMGTGGVLLPYYSPLKVAEQFRMLEALYPGRIDLGIGRAPGGDPVTALAMGEGRYPGAEHFPEQEMQEQFRADELMAITITGDYDSRLKSYELLAAAFSLDAG